MPVYGADAGVSVGCGVQPIRVDERTEALIRLFAQKIHGTKRSANKIVDKKRDFMENRVNGIKGEVASCEYFEVPYDWEVLDGRGDGGKDLRVGNSTVEIKTTWWSPAPPKGCYLLLPVTDKKQKITADYVVGCFGTGRDYTLFGYVSREEFFSLMRPVEFMSNRPMGVHSSVCHPICDLKAIVDAQKDSWGTKQEEEFRIYRQACAARLAELEKELPPEMKSVGARVSEKVKGPQPHWVTPPKKGQQSLF